MQKHGGLNVKSVNFFTISKYLPIRKEHLTMRKPTQQVGLMEVCTQVNFTIMHLCGHRVSYPIDKSDCELKNQLSECLPAVSCSDCLMLMAEADSFITEVL